MLNLEELLLGFSTLILASIFIARISNMQRNGYLKTLFIKSKVEELESILVVSE